MDYRADLIYDVGMHNGDDTAYYLYKGFRVLAIEANPALVRSAEQRFAAEVEAGKLTILQVGVARERGEAEFHVSTEVDKWSSFDKEVATRGGRPSETVIVPCLPFADILAEHGIPYYVKVDIEGADRLCLEGLTAATAPPCLSIEMDHAGGDADIRQLGALGYTRFKCIRQNDHRPIHAGNLDLELRLRRWRAGPWLSALGVRLVRRLRRELAPARDGDWVFAEGSSGTFGENWGGPWLSLAEVLALWQRLHDVDIELDSAGLAEWFDIHAGR